MYLCFLHTSLKLYTIPAVQVTQGWRTYASCSNVSWRISMHIYEKILPAEIVGYRQDAKLFT
jgi:hypothetical protein